MQMLTCSSSTVLVLVVSAAMLLFGEVALNRHWASRTLRGKPGTTPALATEPQPRSCRPHPPARQAWKGVWGERARVRAIPANISARLMFTSGRSMPVLKVHNQFPFGGTPPNTPMDFSARRCGVARRCELTDDIEAADVVVMHCDFRHATPRQATVRSLPVSRSLPHRRRAQGYGTTCGVFKPKTAQNGNKS